MLCTTRTSRRRLRRRCWGFCTEVDEGGGELEGEDEEEEEEEGDVDAEGEAAAAAAGSAFKNSATSSTLCGAPGKRASAAKISRAEKDGKKPLTTRTCA